LRYKNLFHTGGGWVLAALFVFWEAGNQVFYGGFTIIEIKI
jgi:hypothetical protein